MTKKIDGLKQMNILAKSISTQIRPGDIICLSGDLGAGKTTMVQMIAKEMGVKDVVTSPTFEIIKIYNAKDRDFIHIDAYRLEDDPNKEMFDEYLYHTGFTFVEWSQFLNIKKQVKKIYIKVLPNNGREVSLDGFIF